MFPKDAITFVIELQGTVSTTITTVTPTTVLGYTTLQSGAASDTILFCGSQQIFNNFAKEFVYTPLSFLCNDTLRLEKTGNDTSDILITYVERNIASSTEESFAQGFIEGFTYGDIVISVVAMLIFSIVIYDYLYRWIRGNKIKQD